MDDSNDKIRADWVLPAEASEARRMRMKATLYLIKDNILYKKSYLEPLLRCVKPTQAQHILKEINEGMCGIHSGSRAVAIKANEIWVVGITGHPCTEMQKKNYKSAGPAR